ncbi:MAG TPA: tripartite tricarboxylate transporter substrate binding protein [Burkholderiales bacterium]
MRGLFALMLCAAAQMAAAQYPAKPVRILVPFAAGGVTDIVTRVVAQRMSVDSGASFLVENKTGASGRISYEAAAKSPPDGYTLGAVDGAYPVLPAIYPNLPWDFNTDLVPITISAQTPFVVVVRADGGIKTLAEFIARAKAAPGKMNYGSAGVGGANHVVTELFKRAAGIDLTHVPFRGMGDAMIGLIGGNVDVIVTAQPTAMSNLKSGKIIPLAVTSVQRSKVLPNVPTATEAGYPGFVASNWVGLTAPKGTPPEIINWLHKQVVAAIAAPEVKERLDALGAEPSGIRPDEFALVLRDDAKRWAEVVRAAGIKAE